ncbi:MAG TPA: cytochrome c biogenesis CcdA family protein [Jatrophihabitantaceae bacterium]|jgi:cytochrome c-type biogenesis protein|nr:cytochrome c biogenesis CcdA family protein [Jatrophihabitantaceae bacterium]
MLLANDGLTHAVQDGPLLLGAGAAALVGLVGFLSPCVLPLVPGYLSYVAGLSGTDQGSHHQRRMVVGSLLFVLGFSAVFLVLEGVLFGVVGQSIQDNLVTIERVLGGVTIVLGLAFMGWIPFLQREVRIHRLPPAGLAGAPLLGIAFGLAWGPCLTPTLSAVTSMALTQGSQGRGTVLMVFYCLGLGVPFVLVALGFGWVTSAIGFVRRHRAVVSRVSGALLVAMGVLLVSGTWNHWMDWLHNAVGPNAGIGSSL